MHLQNSACPELVEACPELRRRGPFFSSTPVEERAVLRQAQHERIRDYSISKITASTARLSPCAALTVFTVPDFSARRMFSIFIASTVASGWHASTWSPSPKCSATSRPGIGQMQNLERSGGIDRKSTRLNSSH